MYSKSNSVYEEGDLVVANIIIIISHLTYTQFCSGGPLDRHEHEGFGLFDPVVAVQKAVKEAALKKAAKEAKGTGLEDDDGT